MLVEARPERDGVHGQIEVTHAGAADLRVEARRRSLGEHVDHAGNQAGPRGLRLGATHPREGARDRGAALRSQREVEAPRVVLGHTRRGLGQAQVGRLGVVERGARDVLVEAGDEGHRGQRQVQILDAGARESLHVVGVGRLGDHVRGAGDQRGPRQGVGVGPGAGRGLLAATQRRRRQREVEAPCVVTRDARDDLGDRQVRRLGVVQRVAGDVLVEACLERHRRRRGVEVRHPGACERLHIVGVHHLGDHVGLTGDQRGPRELRGIGTGAGRQLSAPTRRGGAQEEPEGPVVVGRDTRDRLGDGEIGRLRGVGRGAHDRLVEPGHERHGGRDLVQIRHSCARERLVVVAVDGLVERVLAPGDQVCPDHGRGDAFTGAARRLLAATRRGRVEGEVEGPTEVVRDARDGLGERQRGLVRGIGGRAGHVLVEPGLERHRGRRLVEVHHPATGERLGVVGVHLLGDRVRDAGDQVGPGQGVGVFAAARGRLLPAARRRRREGEVEVPGEAIGHSCHGLRER